MARRIKKSNIYLLGQAKNVSLSLWFLFTHSFQHNKLAASAIFASALCIWYATTESVLVVITGQAGKIPISDLFSSLWIIGACQQRAAIVKLLDVICLDDQKDFEKLQLQKVIGEKEQMTCETKLM